MKNILFFPLIFFACQSSNSTNRLKEMRDSIAKVNSIVNLELLKDSVNAVVEHEAELGKMGRRAKEIQDSIEATLINETSQRSQ